MGSAAVVPLSEGKGDSADVVVEAEVVNEVRQQELKKAKAAAEAAKEKQNKDPLHYAKTPVFEPKTFLGRSWLGLVHSVRHPSPLAEMTWKLVLTLVLYSLMISFVIQELVLVTGIGDDLQASYQVAGDTTPRHLRIELTACVMQISVVQGSSVRVMDRSLGQRSFLAKAASKVSLSKTERCFMVSCMGPATEPDFQVLAHLQVGDEANLSFTSVHLLPGDRSSLLVAGGNSSVFGDNFTVVGEQGLVQLEHLQVPQLYTTLRSGLLDIRYPQVAAATLDVGNAAASLHISLEASVDLRLGNCSEMTGKMSDRVCLSDVAGVPAWNETTSRFSLGDDPNASEFTILRDGGTPGALFVTRGVLQHERSADANTFDSMSSSGYQAESDFSLWASSRAKSGAQILRLRVLAPGFDDDMGSIDARSEWLYSLYGHVYIWHPLSAFYFATMGIFAPAVSRTDVVLTSAQCTPRVPLVSSRDFCLPDTIMYGTYGMNPFGGAHMALGQALPEVLSFQNRTASRIYHLRDSMEEVSFMPSIADVVVSDFQYSSQSGASSTLILKSLADRGNFMDLRSRSFAAISIVVCLVLPSFITILAYRFYHIEKAKLLAADGLRIWPILWKAKQQEMEQVALSNAKPTEPVTPGDGTEPAKPPPEQLEAGAIDAECPEQADEVRKDLLSVLARMASSSLTSLVDGVQEVVDQVVDFEMSKAEKDLQSRAQGLLGKSTVLLTFVECIVFRRVGSMSFYSDGLAYASLLVLIHFGIIQVIMLPVAAVVIVNFYNVADYQGVYFLFALLNGEVHRHHPLSITGWIIILATECFMLLYTIVEYLCRHIDQVILTQKQLASGGLSVHRRRLLNLRASRFFSGAMSMILLTFLHIGMVMGITFSLYLLLGACVAPETVGPILIGVIATVYVGRQTAMLALSSTRRLQAQLMKTVSEMHSDAATVSEALEETLMQLGLNDAQVLLFSLAIAGTFACAVAFVLLGSSLFITAESIAPAFISGLATITGALAAARSGAGAEDTIVKFEALKNFNAKVQEVQQYSKEANDAVQAAKNATKQAVEGAKAAKTAVTAPATSIAGPSDSPG